MNNTPNEIIGTEVADNQTCSAQLKPHRHGTSSGDRLWFLRALLENGHTQLAKAVRDIEGGWQCAQQCFSNTPVHYGRGGGHESSENLPVGKKEILESLGKS